jgi:phosphoglycolate phosphatase
MKKNDGIIFDVDGTLWDSTEKVAAIYNRTIQESQNVLRDTPVTAELLKKEFGKPMIAIGYDLFPELSKDACRSFMTSLCSRENQMLAQDPPSPYPGAVQTIRTLSLTHPVFIVSNCQGGYIELFIEAAGLSGCISGHLCPDDTGMEKADNIREIISRYALSAAVYVGDTFGDFLATKEAGIEFIHAAYGFGKVPDPDYIINQPADLLKLSNL